MLHVIFFKKNTTAVEIFLELQAVVCRSKSPGTFLPLQLTVDHSPIHFEERMRIQKAGGNVKFVKSICL